MIKKRLIENVICSFIIIYSIAQLIYSISYISDISKYSGNNMIGPIFNALVLLSFLLIGIICLFSQNRKAFFITLSIICFVLFVYSFILNINSIRNFQRISNEFQLSASITISGYISLINMPLTFLFTLSIFCIFTGIQHED